MKSSPSRGRKPPDLSVVIPLLNEEENLERLYHEIVGALDSSGLEFEILFVDDGSSDGSFARIEDIAAVDGRVRGLRLARNFGQSAALQAGIDAAWGQILVTLDGDLQNDPADIPRLLEVLDSGYDVVCGWRQSRKARWLSRRLPSWLANRIIAALTGVRVHDHGCTLKAMRRHVIADQPLYTDMHRFMLVLMSAAGGRYAEIHVVDRPRVQGRSKYGLSRIWRVMLDLLALLMMARFAAHPTRWFALWALPFVVLAVVFGGTLVHEHLMPGPAPNATIVEVGATLLCIAAVLHLLLLGVVGELIGWSAINEPAGWASTLTGSDELENDERG